MEKKERFNRLQTIISNVMGLDTDEIELQFSLVDDLGIESVDLVDISAKIEEAFNIEIGEGELWNFGESLANDDLVENGKITEQGVKIFQKQLCIDDFQSIQPGASIIEVLSMIKISFIVNYLSKKLG